jgi:hypothetical protein
VVVQLASVITDLEAALDSPRPAEAAAKKLEDVMRTGTSRMIGADLRMSGFKGPPVTLDGQHKPSLAWIELGGATYNLADKGRQKARKFIYPKHKARAGKVRKTKKTAGRKGHKPTLKAPGGYRYRVKGSRTRGKRITDTYAPRALEEATVAAAQVVADIFVRTV